MCFRIIEAKYIDWISFYIQKGEIEISPSVENLLKQIFIHTLAVERPSSTSSKGSKSK